MVESSLPQTNKITHTQKAYTMIQYLEIAQNNLKLILHPLKIILNAIVAYSKIIHKPFYALLLFKVSG